MANKKPRYKDETGIKHGHLMPLRYVRTDRNRGAMFECRCDCGNITLAGGPELRAGTKISCGCARHLPRKPKADFCVVCGAGDVYLKNMCRRCYFKQWHEKKQKEMERYL